MTTAPVGPGEQSDSGVPLDEVYLEGPDPPPPGTFPYTRGIRPRGYRDRLWTMRQYAGFGSATETNQRFHYLLAAGQTGLSTAFDLPTQMGYDSDDTVARGEVGRVGVAIDSIADMRALLRGLPLDRVTTSMTINAPASILLLLYELVAAEQGIDPDRLGGTIQNDVLKEYAARGTYIFPPRPSMRLVVDTMAYCATRLPRWNSISISGYHLREAGATAVQEIAFTIANGIAYASTACDSGLAIDDIAPRLSFFFNVSNDFFEEVAKFRAARSVWADVMRERFGARDPRSHMMRFHAQTSGATLTAQQPLNNVVRVALQSLAAVCGGAQSLHANGYDEALALPSEEAAEIALRTQQVIAFESGVARVTDPLGGAHFVETLTERLIEQSRALISRIDDLGGAVAAIDSGFYQREIEESAYSHQKVVESGTRVVVGVNRFTETTQPAVPLMEVQPRAEFEQVQRLQQHRVNRDGTRVDQTLAAIIEVARSSDNLLPAMRQALEAGATVGEVCTALKTVFGAYRPSR